MSHFVCHVLVPADIDADNPSELTDYLDTVLQPFSEELEVEPYIVDHYTVEQVEEARQSKYSTEIKHLPDLAFLHAYTGREKITIHPKKGGYNMWTTYNPESKWDWWTIGGRWSNYFFNRTDCVTVADAIRNFHDSIETARVRYEEEFDLFAAATEGLEYRTWDEIHEQISDIYEARAVYHSQPWVIEAKKVTNHLYYLPETYFMLSEGGREAFVRNSASRTVVPYSAVTLDGKWVARGEMGWFGMSDDDVTQSQWQSSYFDLLAQAPLNARVVSLDLHI